MALLTGKVHKLYGAVRLGADYIDQNAELSLSPGLQTMLISNGVDNSFAAIARQDPRVRVGTSAVATALALSGIGGLEIAAGATELDFWLRQGEFAGTYTAGAAHLQITGHNGLFYPLTLNADGVSAAIRYEFAPAWDGTNDPLVLTPDQALGGTPAVDEAFVVGPVMINGVQLRGIQSVAVNFGIQVFQLFHEGEIWCVYLDIQKRSPSIVIRTADALSFNTFGLTVVAHTATDSLIYLRAVEENKDRHANAETEHIKIAVDDGIIYVSDLSGDANTPYNGEVTIEPTWDGTNAVLAITTGQAIVL